MEITKNLLRGSCVVSQRDEGKGRREREMVVNYYGYHSTQMQIGLELLIWKSITEVTQMTGKHLFMRGYGFQSLPVIAPVRLY